MGERTLNRFFLFVLVIVVPIFDSLTGLLVRGDTLSSGGVGTPSQLIRFALIGLSIVIIQSRQRYIILLIASMYLISMETASFVAHQSIQGLLIGLVFSYKFVYAAFIFFALDKIFTKEGYTEKDVLLLIYKFTWFLCVTFLIGNLLAIKTGISGSFFRSQGLFSSGNGLGVLIGVLSLLLRYGSQKGFLTETIHKAVYWLSLICLVLIATKASVIFLVVNLIFAVGKLPAIFRYIFLIIFVSVVWIYWTPISNALQIAFELIIFRFEHKSSWLGFILSGREDYLDKAFSSFNRSSFLLLRTVFGAGSFLSYELPGELSLNYKMLEMDSFDTFFFYGLLGLVLYFSLIFYCTRMAFRQSRILGWCSVTLFAHSVFAGHTLYNGLSATGIVFILLIIKHSKKRKQYELALQ